MLTSLKLNAVEVIKFTGEYNYIVKEGYLNKSYVKLGVETITIFLKITQSHVFLQNLAKYQYFLKGYQSKE